MTRQREQYARLIARGVSNAQAGRRVEVFIAQDHAPAAEAEVDFGEVWVILDGVKTKCFMFVLWLAHSGKTVHRVYPTQSQEAFLQGHIEAFDAIGGVPTVRIRYDNLKAAVSSVVHGPGRERRENDRWVLFRSHYGFDAFYCQPGIEGAHEKGGVEGAVGYFRRNRLSPMPEVASLAELNEQIQVWEALDERRRITGRVRTIGQDFATERPMLRPLHDSLRVRRMTSGARPAPNPRVTAPEATSPEWTQCRPGSVDATGSGSTGRCPAGAAPTRRGAPWPRARCRRGRAPRATGSA